MIGKKNIRERLKNNDYLISIMLRYPVAASVEVLALAGVDLMIIDNEHYPFDEQTMLDLVRAADVHGMATVVRVPNAEPNRIAQIMDYGVDGIMVPSVDTYEEARQIFNAVKYAPIGMRGYCPITRAASYGLDKSPSEYAAFANEHSVIIIQIETKTGFENMDKILTIPEIDCIDYGPSDLAASYGMPGHNNDPFIQDKVKEIMRKAVEAGKNAPIMVYSPEGVTEALNNGHHHIMIGSDQQLLAAGVSALVGAVKE